MMDRVEDIGRARGTPAQAVLDLPPAERDALFEDLRAEFADRIAANAALAETVAGTGEPTVRSVAIAMSTTFEVPGSHRPAARLALFERWCGEPAGFGPAEREALRAQVRATDHGERAVAGALVGLRDAWRDGDEDEIRAWAEDLGAARDRCRTWGAHGRLAHDPRLAWDGAPLAARPEGFAAAARDFAQQTGMTLIDARCDAPPCVARFDSSGARRRFRDEADRIWGRRGYGSFGWGSEANQEVVLVAVNPEAGLGRTERLALAQARGGPRYRCLDEAAWSTVGAELADVVGAPQDWEGALRAAVFACHRDPAVGPAEHRVAAGRWDGRWTFDPPEPLLDCVAERVLPHAPPAGTEITLETWVL